MPSQTTEGLILKRKNFGEADRVLTVLTDRYGKISVIAKGVRRITSRRAGNVELLNIVRLHLFKARNYTLTEAESVETFKNLKSNLVLSSAAFHVIELVDRLTKEDQLNVSVYNLTISVLILMENSPRQIFLRAYEVKLLSSLGFWSIDAIPNLSTRTRKILEDLQFLSWQEINNLNVTKEEVLALEGILRYYCEKILESPLKSDKVLKQLDT